jgi:hypothetical protein
MITLCERCYHPDSGNAEMYSSVPMGPCEQCGSHDQLWSGDPTVNKRHTYPRDPRPIGARAGSAPPLPGGGA